MKKIILSLIVVATTFFNAKASTNYRLESANIDYLFLTSIPIENDPVLLYHIEHQTKISGDKSPVTAFVLCWVLGGLGIHRFYLGTNFGTGCFYVCTLGGCGVLTTIDWIFLLIAVINKEDISKYENNKKLFMWGAN